MLKKYCATLVNQEDVELDIKPCVDIFQRSDESAMWEQDGFGITFDSNMEIVDWADRNNIPIHFAPKRQRALDAAHKKQEQGEQDVE